MSTVDRGHALEAIGFTLLTTRAEWPGEDWWAGLGVLLQLSDLDEVETQLVKLELMAKCGSIEPVVLFDLWCSWLDAHLQEAGMSVDVGNTSLFVAGRLRMAGRPDLAERIGRRILAEPDPMEEVRDAARRLLPSS